MRDILLLCNDLNKKAQRTISYHPPPLATTALSHAQSIICCSSNGSIREWSVAHEVKNTRFLAQMWEHNGFITDVVSEPAPRCTTEY